SQVGKGTLAEVYLARVDEEPTAIAQSGKIVRGGETILLVEDHCSLREVIRHGLERNGYKVVTAENGMQAIDVAQSYGQPIDLLITDVIMPGMSGGELAKHLSEQRPGISVLYISGYPDDMLGEGGEINPDVLLLKKPFDVVSLLAKTREALESTPVRGGFPWFPAA